MVPYALVGALIGSMVGYFIPPGYFFWFVVGAVGGALAQKSMGNRF